MPTKLRNGPRKHLIIIPTVLFIRLRVPLFVCAWLLKSIISTLRVLDFLLPESRLPLKRKKKLRPLGPGPCRYTEFPRRVLSPPAVTRPIRRAITATIIRALLVLSTTKKLCLSVTVRQTLSFSPPFYTNPQRFCSTLRWEIMVKSRRKLVLADLGSLVMICI